MTDATHQLLEQLQDQNEQVRISTLRELAHAHEKLVSTVLRLLENDPVQEVKRNAIVTLGEIGKNVPAVGQAIAAYANHVDQPMRKASVRALGGLGVTTPVVLDALIDRLDNKNEKMKDMRRAAARSLGQLKADTPKVRRALSETTENDPRIEVKLEAGKALSGLGRKNLIDINDNISNDKDNKIRMNSVLLPMDQEQLAAEYDAFYHEMLKDREALLEKLGREFAPRFNAKVKQKWEQEKPTTHENRELFVKWIMEQLDGLGLTLFDSRTHRAAWFMITGRDEFRLLPTGGRTGRTSKFFDEFLPLQIAVSGPHKESQIERLEQVATQQRSLT